MEDAELIDEALIQIIKKFQYAGGRGNFSVSEIEENGIVIVGRKNVGVPRSVRETFCITISEAQDIVPCAVDEARY